MTVYVLEPDDRVVAVNRLVARIGFVARGAEVAMFGEAAFDDLPLQAEDIVVGGVGFAQRAMRRLGIEPPAIDSVPPPLAPFAGREIRRAPMRDLRARVAAGEALFAKPLATRLKSFDGRLFASFGDLIPTAHVDDDEIVECATPIDLVSEHRCFILYGDPIDLRPYKGDPLVFPDPETIRAAIAAYADGPMGYALDFGVLASGETVVVEVNDGYAVGAYGLAPVKYAALIEARWSELRREGRG